MNRKSPHASTSKSDDLELITGVGPAVAARLNKHGIRSFEQVAAFTPAQLAKLIEHVQARRIIKEDWIGQARQLAAQQTRPAHTDQQHYATFTLELLLDEKQVVRRTQVRHVQSGVDEAWANWDEKRLLHFVLERSKLHVSREHAPAVRRAVPDEEQAAHMPRLLDTTVSLVDKEEPQHLFGSGQPFSLWLTIDMSDLALPPGEPLDVIATVYGRDWHDRCRVLGETHTVLTPTDRLRLALPGAAVPPGVYRLSATAFLMQRTPASPLAQGWTTTLNSGLLQVV